MIIYCKKAGDCLVQHTVVMDEPAGATLSVPSNVTANTITMEGVVEEQDVPSSGDYVSLCSPVIDDPNARHYSIDVTFLNSATQYKWVNTFGSISTISICGDPNSDVRVCGTGTVAAARNGDPQLCSPTGMFQAVYTGQSTRGTNGCNGNDALLYFTIIGALQTPYDMCNLSFDEPVVTSVVSLGGQ